MTIQASARASFAVLDGATGWRTGWTRNIGQPERGPLQLDGTGGGSQAFTDRPPWLERDPLGNLFLLTTQGHVKRFDLCSWRFVEWIDASAGDDGTATAGPSALAGSGRELAVLDAGRREVRVYSLATGALRNVISSRTDAPVALAADDGSVFVLSASGAILRAATGSFEPTPLASLGEGTWARLGIDRDGDLYALDTATTPSRLLVVDQAGRAVGERTDGVAAAAGFHPLGVTFLTDVVFRVGDRPATFGRDGDVACLPPTSVPRPAGYARDGTWVSAGLDSEIYRCQWHRVEIEADVPAGTSLAVRTHGADDAVTLSSVLSLDDDQWDTNVVLSGPLSAEATADVLVRSRPARYLWLRIDLQGDGFRTPIVGRLRVEYPRRSWLRYLPAVYAAEDESADFLARFLSIFQDELEGIEAINDDIARLFDPAAVPDRFVDYLAGWLGSPTEGTWDAKQRRHLLQTTRAIYQSRGTPASIRRNVRAYVENLIGADVGEDQLPQLVEGFRERRYHELGARLGQEQPLWSAGYVARLQTDRNDLVGHVRLVSVGDPSRDLFAHHAHRFRVVLPAPWIRTEAEARMIRRAIDAQRPAHTAYELDLVHPAMRVGVQSTLGLDTIVGELPVLRLSCSGERPAEATPAKPLGLRGLGVLGGTTPHHGNVLVHPGIRLGRPVPLS
jgi:phage tail-like protein